MEKITARISTEKLFCILLFIIVACMFYSLCVYTPLYADDLAYSFIFGTNDCQRVESVKDIVQSMIGHYNIQNGRIITQASTQYFLLIGKQIFNIFDTCMFILLCILIYFHGVGNINIKDKKAYIIYLFIFFALFKYLPSFGQSLLWLIGSCNYLIPTVSILIFLIPFRNYLIDNNKSYNILFTFYIFIFGFICGAMNESYSIGLIAFLLLYIFYSIVIKRYKLWMTISLIGVIFGLITILVAPGELHRISVSGYSDITIYTFLIQRLKYFTIITTDMFFICFGLFTMIISEIIILYINNKEKFIKFLTNHTRIIYSLLLLFYFISSVYVMIFVKCIPERVWLLPIVFLIIISINLFLIIKNMDMFNNIDDKKICTVKYVCVIFMLISLVGLYADGLWQVHRCYRFDKERTASIYEQKSKGIEEVFVKGVISKSRFACYGISGDLNFDKYDEWPNSTMAKYYDVKFIKRSGSSEY